MQKEPPRLFIDSNVLFSAIYGSVNCARLIQAHINNTIIAVVSQQVLEETVRNIREKAPHALSLLQNFIIHSPPEVVASAKQIDPRIRESVDKKDLYIFADAIQANVPYFITGNTKDFFVSKLEKLTVIKILTPKEAVELLKL